MRNKLLLFSATALVLLLSLGTSAFAHHGVGAWYDTTRSITVKGTVTSFEWTNPHTYIYFDVKDANGAIQKWTAEMGSVGMLGRAGWRRETLKPGDAITVTGKPAKDGKSVVLLDKAVLASGQELFNTPTPAEGTTPPAR
jgi:Family of unknown function (DUF6152)